MAKGTETCGWAVALLATLALSAGSPVAAQPTIPD
jgi:hypothetical protein